MVPFFEGSEKPDSPNLTQLLLLHGQWKLSYVISKYMRTEIAVT